MDKIVRIRHCETCCIPVFEEYTGRQPATTPLTFENKLYTVAFVPPEGAGKKYCLCEDCAKSVMSAIEAMLNHGKGRVS